MTDDDETPLVSFWSGLVGTPCRRESRLQAAPTARFFAMIGLIYPLNQGKSQILN
jgi:hypothetical protein